MLVYMAAGARDLVAPAELDLRSMEAPSAVPSWSAASTVHADVVVQLRRPAPARIERLHVFQAQSPAPGVQSPIVEAFDTEDVPPGESLRRFVSWGVARYPSRHYAIVVWGHGLGWQPVAPVATTRPGRYRVVSTGGILFEESPDTSLDVPSLGRALAAAARERLGGRPFDVYASDACLMQSIEVAGELDGSARYVVGSEQIEEDYVGLPYRRWLPHLNGSAPPPPPSPSCPPADAACEAAAELPALRGAVTAGATLSALDEDALSRALLPSLRRLSAAVAAYVAEDDLRRIGLRTLLGPDRGPLVGTPGFRGGTRDVGVFLDRLSAQVQREPGAAGTPGQQRVLDAVAEARASLHRTVIAASFGARYLTADYAGMAGLSLWLPRDAADYRARAGFFATTRLHGTPAGEPSFGTFLDRIFAAD